MVLDSTRAMTVNRNIGSFEERVFNTLHGKSPKRALEYAVLVAMINKDKESIPKVLEYMNKKK